MTLQILYLLASLVLFFLGAEGLVRGSASLALRLGLTPLVVGLTVVAFGTSAPELVVSLQATLTGRGDIAVGNVIGSNIFNIGLILGTTALICPIRVDLPVLKLDAPLMVFASIVVAGILATSGTIETPVGCALAAGLIGYTAFTVWMTRKGATPATLSEFDEGTPDQSRSVFRDLVFILIGLLLLVGGSHLLVNSATFIARSFGISEAIIGLTIVAAGTSMPELATSLLAALRRQPDIAIGNIIGSNLFNLFGILGLSAAVRPVSAPGINQLELWVMVAFAIALLPLMWTDRRLQRWEGVLLLAGFGGYLAAIWP
ncbi:MAG: calcium/sodium antiporter [Chthoniobacterales bacterium]